MIILDGWGIRKEKRGNAVSLAKTPCFDSLKEKYPYREIKASGEAVGLAEGMMGNSETGHLNLGAGRVVEQDILKINRSIEDKSFFKNPAFKEAVDNVKKNNSSLHLMGLLSDAGVHSHQNHLFALMKMARENELKNVFIHIFSDGRDTSIKSVHRYLDELKRIMEGEKIATLIGRYYALDRDKRWSRTKKAYSALVKAKGVKAESASKALEEAYQRGETDEFIRPTVIGGYQGIKKNDSIIFFNFRSDRPRQLSRLLTKKGFNLTVMTEYYKGIKAGVAFKKRNIKNTLSEVLSREGLSQLKIAETEKYPHVTFFFNGEEEEAFPGEKRVIVPSPKVATYDLKPEMSARKLTKELLKRISKYQVVVLNFANPDMVGHTGNLKATIKAVETVDGCLEKIISSVKKGTFLITADHGNAEEMIDKEGNPISCHSTNLVPFILVSDNKYKVKREGKLSNIAPTILELLRIKKPKEMIDSLIDF